MNYMLENLKIKILLFFLFIVTFFYLSSGSAKGDLTRQQAEVLEITMEGKKGSFHKYIPSKISLENGKLYKIILINSGDSKHHFTSPKFANAVFTRKV